MPPKGKQNQQKRASQQGRAQVVPIEGTTFATFRAPQQRRSDQ